MSFVGRFLVLSLAVPFVGLFVLSLGRSFVGGRRSSVHSFLFVGG